MSKPNSKLLSIAPHLLRCHARLRHFEFRQAVSEDDFEAALRIRNDVYLDCGYIDPAYPQKQQLP